MQIYSVILEHKVTRQMKFVTVEECADFDECVDFILATEPDWQIEQIRSEGGKPPFSFRKLSLLTS